MKKVAVAVGVLIMAVWAITMVAVKKDEGKTNNTQEPGATNMASESANIAMSQLLEVFKQGKDLSCSYTKADKVPQEKGVIHVSGIKYRGDFELNIDGKISKVHAIGDGVWYYVWTEGRTQALKLNILETAGAEAATNSAAKMLSLYTETDAKSQLNCQEWKADGALFVAPTDYMFIDMTERLKQLRNNSGEQ